MIRAYTWLMAVSLASLLIFTACASEPEHSGPVMFQLDSAVKEQKNSGPDFNVTEFRWSYQKETDQLKVVGVAENESDKGIQSVRIIAEAFDQFNEPIGASETFLAPTYVQPGAKAHFEFYLPQGKWVESIRLKYRFETRY